MTTTVQTTSAQSIEALAGHITEAMLSLIKTGHQLAARQSERVTAALSQFDEQSSQLGNVLFDAGADLGRANLDIALTCNQLAINSASTYWRELFGCGRSIVDKGVAASMRLMEARSPDEALAIQAEYLKTSADDVLAESAKLYELIVKTTDAALEPLGAHMADTVVEIKRAKAA